MAQILFVSKASDVMNIDIDIMNINLDIYFSLT